MKNSYFLSLVIVLSIVVNSDASQGLTAEQRKEIEAVQSGKFTQQKEMARPSIYKTIDPLVVGQVKIDWPVVFSILDSMKGIINVNEYRTFDQKEQTLLSKAVEEGDVSVVQKLLQVYGANPNVPSQSAKAHRSLTTPLMYVCLMENIPMIKVMLQYGGNPNLKNARGINCFKIAEDNSEILNLLAQYKK